ncbi:hypothetical protein DL764_008038 [Monosporascus ibericus]|uniref:Uncharacterized protein n=1 Tax=Monosporascus ibericus TaxID=155417 RepID=A0A4Q4T0S2_9PEZI|nr:hypothetical protein DL764_008038 [Monosporascus ibericus]
MVRNKILAPLSLLFLAGAIVMMFLVILAGVTRATPLDETYFLRADTSGITGARPTTQWTYFHVCSPGNVNCGGPWPDPPVGWAWDSDTENVPTGLAGSYGGDTTSSYYYYMWRFGWVFYLLGLFFTVIAFFIGILAYFGRLGAAISGLTSLTALFFFTLAASLMTATFVKMRNEFRSAGRSAGVGSYSFGFTWAALTCLTIATALFFLGWLGAKRDGGYTGGRFRRRRSVRSRQSYDAGGHRVKDNYA